MGDRTSGILGGLLYRRCLSLWRQAEEYARTAPLDRLRPLQKRARRLAVHLTGLNAIAETRLIRPVIGSTAMNLPLATEFAHRPGVWSGPVTPHGHAPARSETRLGDEVTLYHDCPDRALSLRQIRNSRPSDLAPFGLALDIYQFRGSFLSLVIESPKGLVEGITRDHVLRLSLDVEAEAPVEIDVRLNLRHGPNTQQVNRPVDLAAEVPAVEFDLAYVPFDEETTDHLWFDLFITDPALNRIVIRDLTLSRHPRAEP